MKKKLLFNKTSRCITLIIVISTLVACSQYHPRIKTIFGRISLPDTSLTNQNAEPLLKTSRRILTVNSAGSEPDCDMSDGLCRQLIGYDSDGNPICGNKCTLFSAIAEVSSGCGTHTNIHFNIPGSNPHRIQLPKEREVFELPCPVTIDGTTQPGYNGTPVIEVVNGNLLLMGGNSTIRGLAINSSNEYAIGLSVKGGNRIESNFIGTDITGTKKIPNSMGIMVFSPNNIIGGLSPASRNIISGNRCGIYFLGGNTTNNKVIGNYIGIAKDGISPLGNEAGIYIDGLTAAPMGAPTNNIIGGHKAGSENVIAFNQNYGGVLVVGEKAQSNKIIGNSIFGNKPIGIDLGGDGQTPNDIGDKDEGPNSFQNFPILTSVSMNNGSLEIAGELHSTPNRSYHIDLFSNNECTTDGITQGEKKLGDLEVTTDQYGSAIFHTSANHILDDKMVSSTATDLKTNNTSEFSSCLIVDIDVDSDNDNHFDLPSRTGPEDIIEDYSEDRKDHNMPGKILFVNNDDGDADGVIDYLDGFDFDNKSGTADDIPPNKSEGELFVPVVISIPKPIDLNKAKLEIRYEDADPNSPIPKGNKGPGLIRLWKLQGYQKRNKMPFTKDDGDYVPPTKSGQFYSPEDLIKLGFSKQKRFVVLYAEAVTESSDIADQRIEIKVIQDENRENETLTDAVRLTSFNFDIDVDSNRDKEVTELDEQGENIWEKGSKAFGAIVLPNVDKDNDGKLPDNWANRDWGVYKQIPDYDLDKNDDPPEDPPNDIVDNEKDIEDLAPLWISKLGPAKLPDQLEVILKVENPEKEAPFFWDITPENRIRIFFPSKKSGNNLVVKPKDKAVIGPKYEKHDLGSKANFVKEPYPDSAEYKYNAFKGRGIIEAKVEGLEFGSLVDIVMSLELNEKKIGPSRRVKMRVAPFILLSNADPAESIYLTNNDWLVPSITVLKEHYKDKSVEIIADFVDEDPFHQDEYEIGYVKAPYGQMHVVMDVPRNAKNNHLQKYMRTKMLAPSMGVGVRIAQGDKKNSANYGGGIETVPIKKRTFWGFLHGKDMEGYQRKFFRDQKVNEPLKVNAKWLEVGHVDEVLTVTPNGKHLIAADSELAWALVVLANKKNPKAIMNKGLIDTPTEGIMVSELLKHPRVREYSIYDKNIKSAPYYKNMPAMRKAVEIAMFGKEQIGVSIPKADTVNNQSDTVLKKAGAFLAYFPKHTDGQPKKYKYIIKFDTLHGHRMRYWLKELGQDWNEAEEGFSDRDSVFQKARVYILANWWDYKGGNMAAHGDVFTFEVDPNIKSLSMPVLFNLGQWGGLARAFTINHVNAIFDRSTVLTGKPFGPKVQLEKDGPIVDIFKNYVTAIFMRAGFEKDNILFADMRKIHNNQSLIHCNSNVKRKIPDVNWWEYLK